MPQRFPLPSTGKPSLIIEQFDDRPRFSDSGANTAIPTPCTPVEYSELPLKRTAMTKCVRRTPTTPLLKSIATHSNIDIPSRISHGSPHSRTLSRAEFAIRRPGSIRLRRRAQRRPRSLSAPPVRASGSRRFGPDIATACRTDPEAACSLQRRGNTHPRARGFLEPRITPLMRGSVKPAILNTSYRRHWWHSFDLSASIPALVDMN